MHKEGSCPYINPSASMLHLQNCYTHVKEIWYEGSE